MAIAVQPQREVGIAAVEGVGRIGLIGRVGEERHDPLQLRNRRLNPLAEQVREFSFDLAGIFFLANLMHQDLDPRLVLVIAPAIAVVDPQAGLRIGDQLIERHEVADQRRDHRSAAHAAADIEGAAQLT